MSHQAQPRRSGHCVQHNQKCVSGMLETGIQSIPSPDDSSLLFYKGSLSSHLFLTGKGLSLLTF